jgi:hypothetical protein
MSSIAGFAETLPHQILYDSEKSEKCSTFAGFTPDCSDTEDDGSDAWGEGDTSVNAVRNFAAQPNTNSSYSPEGTDITKHPKTVAIFADYDGCFDLISPSNPTGGDIDKMFADAEKLGINLHPKSYAEHLLTDFLGNITDGADHVILFCGSNRQCRRTDEFNARSNGNGLASIGLKRLAEKNGWQFNPVLLEDVGANPNDIMNTPGGSSKIKQMLAENNFTCLTGPTEVYFFDDVQEYLNYVRFHAKIPRNIELKTVLFDWYGICFNGTQDGPLSAGSFAAI